MAGSISEVKYALNAFMSKYRELKGNVAVFCLSDDSEYKRLEKVLNSKDSVLPQAIMRALLKQDEGADVNCTQVQRRLNGPVNVCGKELEAFSDKVVEALTDSHLVSELVAYFQNASPQVTTPMSPASVPAATHQARQENKDADDSFSVASASSAPASLVTSGGAATAVSPARSLEDALDAAADPESVGQSDESANGASSTEEDGSLVESDSEDEAEVEGELQQERPEDLARGVEEEEGEGIDIDRPASQNTDKQHSQDNGLVPARSTKVNATSLLKFYVLLGAGTFVTMFAFAKVLGHSYRKSALVAGLSTFVSCSMALFYRKDAGSNSPSILQEPRSPK